MHPGFSESDSNFSEDTSQKIDFEIARIVQANYELASKILREQKTALINLSEALILWETLDAEQVKQVIQGIDIGVPKISDTKKLSTTTTVSEGTKTEETSKDSNSNTLGAGKILPA